MIRETSRAAFSSIIGELPIRRAQVLNAINKLGKCTNQQIAAYMELEINFITPRVGELERSGLVITKQTTLNHRGRVCRVWELSESAKQQLKNNEL